MFPMFPISTKMQSPALALSALAVMTLAGCASVAVVDRSVLATDATNFEGRNSIG